MKAGFETEEPKIGANLTRDTFQS